MNKLKMDDGVLASAALALLIVLPTFLFLDYFNIYSIRSYPLILGVITSIGFYVVLSFVVGSKSYCYFKEQRKRLRDV